MACEALCLHCIEDYEWVDGNPGDVCPTCLASGHSAKGKCDTCDHEYFRKMAELKAQIDERVRREHPEAGR